MEIAIKDCLWEDLKDAQIENDIVGLNTILNLRGLHMAELSWIMIIITQKMQMQSK